MKYDIILKNGCIVDGTGSPFFRGDVAIQGERIVKVGRADSAEAKEVINAAGLIVSPGFVDVHTHAERGILENPNAENYLKQGVTTVVAGNCGSSAGPVSNLSPPKGFKTDFDYGSWTTLGEFFDKLKKRGIAFNFASFVGLRSIMIKVMGSNAWERSPTSKEMKQMKQLVSEAMNDGAIGLSTGLEYPPQSFIDTPTIIELCKVTSKYGGIHATHVRSRDLLNVEAAKEAIAIAEQANVPLIISHFGCRFPADGKEYWHVKLVEEARQNGLDIAFDHIPHPFDEEGIRWAKRCLSSLLFSGTKYVYKGGQVTADMLKDPKIIEFLKQDLPNRQYAPVFSSRRGLFSTWYKLILIHCPKNPQYIGKNFEEIGKLMGKDPFDAAIALLVAEEDNFSNITCKIAWDSQRGANFILLHPLCSIESDTSVKAPYGKQNIHIDFARRAYDTFPLWFKQIRENKWITLEEAVRKCTGLPAQRVRLMDRGLIRPGMYADLVVFDKDKIQGKATFEQPEQYPEGIPFVLVNGVVVVDKGEHTNALPGKVLRYNEL